MSTITKIVDRPEDAPKESVYPRLVINKAETRVYWALGPGKDKGQFKGVLLNVLERKYDEDDRSFSMFETPGYTSDSFFLSEFSDFSGAITLYNK